MRVHQSNRQKMRSKATLVLWEKGSILATSKVGMLGKSQLIFKALCLGSVSKRILIQWVGGGP